MGWGLPRTSSIQIPSSALHAALVGCRHGRRGQCLRGETGLLDSRARLLVARVGEILWVERTGDQEALAGNFAPKGGATRADAYDGTLARSAQCFHALEGFFIYYSGCT